MSETKYESKITSAPHNTDVIYPILSNMMNLERVRNLIPEDKVRDLTFDNDSIHFRVDGLGQKMGIRVVEREENKTIKFGAEDIPIDMNFWIQLKQVAENDTRIRLTVKADIPMMFKMMIGNKLQTGLDQAAEMLAAFPYNQWS